MASPDRFALTRKEIDAVKALQSTLPLEKFLIKTTQLNDAAAKLFIKAHKATNRNTQAPPERRAVSRCRPQCLVEPKLSIDGNVQTREYASVLTLRASQ